MNDKVHLVLFAACTVDAWLTLAELVKLMTSSVTSSKLGQRGALNRHIYTTVCLYTGLRVVRILGGSCYTEWWTAVARCRISYVQTVCTVYTCLPSVPRSRIYTMSQKTVQNCFCQNFVKFQPMLIIFGRKRAKRLKLCEVQSFSTSPNLTKSWQKQICTVFFETRCIYE